MAGAARPALGPALPAWHPAYLIATWFGSGLLPRTPGTWGSLAALPFAWVLASAGGAITLALAALALFAIGVWASEVYVRRTGQPDPGAVVVDEVAAQWMVLLVATPRALDYLLAFLLFRIFDIAKPWPVRWADERVRGGFGVMLDDVLAAAYAAAVLAFLLWVLERL